MKLSQITSSYWGPKPKLLKWAYMGMGRPEMAYAALAWGHCAELDYLETELWKLNCAALLSIVRVPRFTPTRAMEIIMDILPLHLFIMKEGLATSRRIKGQTPLMWSGVTPNLTHSLTHCWYWSYLVSDLDVEAIESQFDECTVDAPLPP